jgi:hypothetical protein
VRVLRYSWENDGEWSSGKFDPGDDEDGEGELEFFLVWAILLYLQAEWEAANVEDLEMERLSESMLYLASGCLSFSLFKTNPQAGFFPPFSGFTSITLETRSFEVDCICYRN